MRLEHLLSGADSSASDKKRLVTGFRRSDLVPCRLFVFDDISAVTGDGETEAVFGLPARGCPGRVVSRETVL